MSFKWLDNVETGDFIVPDKLHDIQDNIDYVRDQLINASTWNWNNEGISNNKIEKDYLNEMKDAIDDTYDNNICVDNTDELDRGDNDDCDDNTDRVDQGDQVANSNCGDEGDRNRNSANRNDDSDCGDLGNRSNEGDEFDRGNDGDQGDRSNEGDQVANSDCNDDTECTTCQHCPHNGDRSNYDHNDFL